ncbi:MAG: CPBP family intramembrane glutamic endopeptidase, partial [Gemmatimonadota bacterium]|nr:CPBP family intramembrane glutamic endopeptidase [Gemmatimonadota bacterium]
RPVLKRWGKAVSIIVIGLLFGMFHLDFRLLPLLSLIGFLLTWVAIRTSSIWPAVAFHLSNNALGLILINRSTPHAGNGWLKGTEDMPSELFLNGIILLAGGAALLVGWNWKKTK